MYMLIVKCVIDSDESQILVFVFFVVDYIATPQESGNFEVTLVLDTKKCS